MKVLLTGASGQLGQALINAKPAGIELIATSRNGGPEIQALDLADGSACKAAVNHYEPDWVLNAGAYTAVDQAESEPELALAVNAKAPEAFAEAMNAQGGRLLQISTDFVFNGQQGVPYSVDQARDPIGVYGTTKAKGEEAVEALMGSSGKGYILRTSWVIGPVGKNFALTMLRLHQERKQFGVVADQVGCPSSTLNLAAACWHAIEISSCDSQPIPPVLHWSDAGAASWFDVSVAVSELALELGLLEQAAKVEPIQTSDYPTPATRPSYSLLECNNTRSALGLTGQHWRQALREVLQEIPR
ncbi:MULTISPECIES: dTDP-4-dehydrorhamnose reductase [unclassified Synechococcus]|uniref:dTDP-4-dehydrorhamnose reductase n=1 Tax=unclassified Synechococcus TaxID=2626047 RepID=UPI0039B0BE43